MNSDIRFLLRLLGATVSNSDFPKINNDVDWNKLYTIVSNHRVLNIFAYGVLSGKYNVDAGLSDALLKAMSDSIAIEVRQSKAFSELFDEFEKEGIDYMPLKGVLVKKLYASHDMRRMSDADILIRNEQVNKADAVMKKLGYDFVLESNHELNYSKPPYINVELHKMLVPSYNDDLYAYYGDGWRFAKQVASSCRYEMSKEDMFVYLFIHFAKHYRDAGVGIKYIVDIWLYLKKLPGLDMKYVLDQFEKLNVRDFYNNIIKLTRCWFEDGEYDETICEMTRFILNSGEFGNIKNAASSKAIRDYMNKDISKAKKYRILRLAFPDFNQMKDGFPVLEKYPYLLPVMWFIRLLKGMLFKRKNLKYHKGRIENIDEEYINSYISHMNKVGLDIYNGRQK